MVFAAPTTSPGLCSAAWKSSTSRSEPDSSTIRALNLLSAISILGVSSPMMRYVGLRGCRPSLPLALMATASPTPFCPDVDATASLPQRYPPLPVRAKNQYSLLPQQGQRPFCRMPKSVIPSHRDNSHTHSQFLQKLPAHSTKAPVVRNNNNIGISQICLLYTSDAADDLTRVDLGGRRIIKKKKKKKNK